MTSHRGLYRRRTAGRRWGKSLDARDIVIALILLTLLVAMAIGSWMSGRGPRLPATRAAGPVPAEFEIPAARTVTGETPPTILRISNARLTLDSGARVRIPTREPDYDETAAVELLSGALRADVGPRLDMAEFHVRTFNAVCGVRGTRFWVRIEGEATKVRVERGSVLVRNLRGEAVLLEAGDEAEVDGEEAPRRLAPARGGPRAQGDAPGRRGPAVLPWVPEPEGSLRDTFSRSGPRTAHAPLPGASGGRMGSGEIEREILDTYRRQYGEEGARAELLRSYGRLQGSSAGEVAGRGDLTAAEREALARSRSVAGASGDTGEELEAGYRRRDAQETGSLRDLHREYSTR